MSDFLFLASVGKVAKGVAFISLEKHLLVYPKVRVRGLCFIKSSMRLVGCCNGFDGLSFTLNEG
jgi:hypothetical protein